MPEFGFRWNPPRDRLLSRELGRPPASPVDPAAGPPPGGAAWTEASGDFWRFLGPEGTASIDGPALDPDWAARPPRQLWRRRLGAGWSGFSTCGDHAVTLEQRGDEEVVTCYSILNGEPEWSVRDRPRWRGTSFHSDDP
ncbi:MAG: hypothetical protein EBZ59_04530 [Planctomycetia bacterium]|nr:hypothetical protein [Planctomycetia bacterium]